MNTKIIKRYASNDLVFKFLFGIEENKKFTIYLVETILNVPHGTIDDIEIINSIKLTPSNILNKTLEMDVYIKVPCLNLNLIVEMQDYLNTNSLKKAYLYLCNSTSKEFKRGEKDYNKHPNFMLIIFVNKFSKELKNYDGRYAQRNNEKPISMLEDLSNIKIIDLAKYDVKCYNNVMEKPVYTFLRTKDETSMKKLLELTKDKEIIKEMKDKMEKFQSQEYVQEYWLDEWLRKTEAKEKEQRSFDKGFNDGKAAGFNDGKTVGFNERNYEIAKKMLQNNKPISEVKLFTDLPTKEINKLIKSLK